MRKIRRLYWASAIAMIMISLHAWILSAASSSAVDGREARKEATDTALEMPLKILGMDVSEVNAPENVTEYVSELSDLTVMGKVGHMTYGFAGDVLTQISVMDWESEAVLSVSEYSEYLYDLDFYFEIDHENISVPEIGMEYRWDKSESGYFAYCWIGDTGHVFLRWCLSGEEKETGSESQTEENGDEPLWAKTIGTCYLRSTPEYGDNVLTEIYDGMNVEVLGAIDGYAHIWWNGKEGYIGSRFLDIDLSSVPAEEYIFETEIDNEEKTDQPADEPFTNAYGTPTTVCAHPGCNEYIARSGDTNCCEKHSRKCLECGKYIDEDAIYCMDCINSAYEKITADLGN